MNARVNRAELLSQLKDLRISIDEESLRGDAPTRRVLSIVDRLTAIVTTLTTAAR